MKTVISGHSFRFSQFLLLFFLISTFVESDLIYEHPEVINIWFILFEFVSAYANVGLSMGVPGYAYSLCGAMSTTSRVLLIFTMLLGKHRAMPRRNDTVVDFKYRYLRKLIAECELLQRPVDTFKDEGRSRSTCQCAFSLSLSAPPIPPLFVPQTKLCRGTAC